LNDQFSQKNQTLEKWGIFLHKLYYSGESKHLYGFTLLNQLHRPKKLDVHQKAIAYIKQNIRHIWLEHQPAASIKQQLRL
jgi:hypothetical protein